MDNCDVIAEQTTPKPLLYTDEPICRTGETACSDGLANIMKAYSVGSNSVQFT